MRGGNDLKKNLSVAHLFKILAPPKFQFSGKEIILKNFLTRSIFFNEIIRRSSNQIWSGPRQFFFSGWSISKNLL